MTVRPVPDWEAPSGFEHVAVPAGADWKVLTGDPRPQCHMILGSPRRRCQNPAAVALLRGYRRRSWWPYCADHTYGRWIEGGVVMEWVLRRVAEDPDR